MSAVVPTLDELDNELSSVTEWERLAIHLGLMKHEVDIIEQDYKVYNIRSA